MSSTSSQAEHPCKQLQPFQTFGWEPQSDLSKDDNFLDLVLILARNSALRDGGMGCVLVRNSAENNQNNSNLYDSILSVATNRSFYTENKSDIHAEVVALGQAARRGRSTQDCTAYITMPPCKGCLAALTMAGVGRLVYFRKTPHYLTPIAEEYDMEVVPISDNTSYRERVEARIAKYYQDNDMDPQEEIAKARQQRKQENQERRKKRKIELEEAGEVNKA